ncbi:dolichyl-phosphate-mannose--protein mannosyltransferase, partial [Klebsiella pneumoniae]|nr:dolichyl-phosphate-mannose--protein mannosyltransferase [Klebsiella pneumoniae]
IAATRWQRLAPERRWLLVHEYAMLSCVDRSRSELAGVANRRRWWLVPATAVKVPCVVTAEERERERRLQEHD